MFFFINYYTLYIIYTSYLFIYLCALDKYKFLLRIYISVIVQGSTLCVHVTIYIVSIISIYLLM